MSNLPEDILLEIFSRLPKRSILRFRCVSKSMCTIFDTTSFQNMHHELSHITNGARLVFNLANKRKKNFAIDYKSVSPLLPLATSSATICEFHEFKFQVDFPFPVKGSEVLYLTSSYDGLIWIRRTCIRNNCEEYYLWNLSTKWYKKIQAPRQVNNDDIKGYGFGYDCMTGDYKLVRIVSNLASNCSDADIYTLESNSWKCIESLPYRLCVPRPCEGVLFNGALYWVVRTFDQSCNVLVCFGIVDERFEKVALPEGLMPEVPLKRDMLQIYVGVLGSCLFLGFHVSDVRIDIWMMKEYGVTESWTKSFSIMQETITSSTRVEFLWTFKNNEILLIVDQGFVLYDPKNKRYRELMLDSRITGILKIKHMGTSCLA